MTTLSPLKFRHNYDRFNIFGNKVIFDFIAIDMDGVSITINVENGTIINDSGNIMFRAIDPDNGDTFTIQVSNYIIYRYIN